MTIHVLIVDDEEPARRRVRRSLGGLGELAIDEATDGAEALVKIREGDYDVVFLDVQMPRVNGFEVAASLGEESPLIVFVTAYDEWAVKAFEVEAVDYLLKPFDENRFVAMWERVTKRLATGDAQVPQRLLERVEANKPLRRIAVKEGEVIQLVNVEEITHFSAEDNYVRVHWSGGSPLIRESLTNLEGRLDSEKFKRIHRSTIVNLDAIATIRPFSHGDYTVVLNDGSELRLSRRFAGSLLG